MNEISKSLIERARINVERFISPSLTAAVVTGSAAKGYADEASDIDTLLFFSEKFSEDEFNRFVEDARATGGNIHLGNPEDGFALYHIIDGIICDFAFIYCNDTENMFREAVEKPVAESIVHLQISGICEGVDLYGSDWVNSLREVAGNYPAELQVLVVKQHLKFHPKWALMKMGYERNDLLFIYETITNAVSNMTGILCGINRMFLPGKIKGIDYAIAKMKIKPVDFIKRYRNLFLLSGTDAVNELYKLIDETCNLVDKHLPEVSTERSREIQNMILRK